MATGGDIEVVRIYFPRSHEVAYERGRLDLSDLGEHDVAVRTRRSLISPGTELALYQGTHIGLADPNNTFAAYPFSPGYAAVADVVATGAGVTDLCAGDRVCTATKHASHQVVSTSSGRPLLPVPDGVPDEEAVFAWLAAISMTAVARTTLRVGDRVVVLGMGLIGNLAAQLFGLAGARTVGIDAAPARLELAHQVGITDTVLADAADGPGELAGRLRQAAGGRAPEIVIEATGNPDLINTGLDIAGQASQVVLLGSPRGRVEIDPYEQIHRKGLSLIGAHANIQGSHGVPSRDTMVATCLRLIAQGALRVGPLRTHDLPADRAAEAYEMLASSAKSALGVILDWRRLP